MLHTPFALVLNSFTVAERLKGKIVIYIITDLGNTGGNAVVFVRTFVCFSVLNPVTFDLDLHAYGS